jgi:hypothetical protein
MPAAESAEDDINEAGRSPSHPDAPGPRDREVFWTILTAVALLALAMIATFLTIFGFL